MYLHLRLKSLLNEQRCGAAQQMTSHVLDIAIRAVAAFKARQVLTVLVGLLGQVTAVLLTGSTAWRVHSAALAHDRCEVKIAAMVGSI